MSTKITKAVIAAAGYGTRFLPQTKSMPKEMLPLVDKPIIQRVAEELVDAGITDIFIVTGYHKRALEDHFDYPSMDLIQNLERGKKSHLIEEIKHFSSMANFIYVRQKGPYGNGTPLINVRNLIGDEPFIYTWADDFIESTPSRFKQLVDCYQQYGSSVLGCVRITDEKKYGSYGFVQGDLVKDNVYKVTKIIEKPGKDKLPSNLASVSGFIFDHKIFDYLEEALINLKPDQELYYADAIEKMLEHGYDIMALEIANSRYYDTGDKLEYMKTVIDFAVKDPEIGEELLAYIRTNIL